MTEPTLPASLSATASLRERVQQVRALREQYRTATEALNASLASLHVSTSYTVSMTEEQYALQRTQHGLESRLDRAASPELVLDLAAALTAEQERAQMLQHDNEGHAEYLSALHQQLLTELPDSETTAALGRLLTAWRRTPDEPQYVPAAALAAAQERMNYACLRLYSRAHAHREAGEFAVAQGYSAAADIAYEEYRAAFGGNS